MKVLIIETSYPKDFYKNMLDGNATHHLLNVLGIESELRYALDKKHFAKAFERFADGGFDVLHISCHGDKDGPALCNKTNVDWPEFAALFQRFKCAPTALVMSACCGASSGIEDAFENEKYRPNIIFGSTDERDYEDYLVAWAILYRIFKRRGVNREDAKTALRHISAVVHPAFIYRRWKEADEEYRHFPTEGGRYVVCRD